MNSTQKSNEILRVEDLSLSFGLNFYGTNSIRDSFVNFYKSPFGLTTKNKESLKVFSRVNFSLNKGDRLGILGVNGSGKTSLCKCISSMLTPDSGKIYMPKNSHPLAIFSTSTGVNPELTGRENAYLLSLLLFPDLNKTERKDSINEACLFSELGHFLDVPIKYYSKGMQTRLFLSVVSIKTADLLILDEVFDGADSFFKEKISKRIMSMIFNSGAAIFVTHEFASLEKVCNRALIMHNSEILFDGSVEEAKEIYNNLSPS